VPVELNTFSVIVFARLALVERAERGRHRRWRFRPGLREVDQKRELADAVDRQVSERERARLRCAAAGVAENGSVEKNAAAFRRRGAGALQEEGCEGCPDTLTLELHLGQRDEVRACWCSGEAGC